MFFFISWCTWGLSRLQSVDFCLCFFLFKASRDLQYQKVVKTTFTCHLFLASRTPTFSMHKCSNCPCPQLDYIIFYSNNRSVHYWQIISPVPWCQMSLTVEGIPGDLTSHGWMQGAFTSSLSTDGIHGYSHSPARPRRPHYPGTTPCTQCDSAAGWVRPKPYRHEAAGGSQRIQQHPVVRFGPRRDHAEINIKGGDGGGASTM